MNPAAVSQLVTHLRIHRATITEAWLRAVRSDPEIASAQGLAPTELADHLPALFNDLINYFQVSATESARQRVRQEARKHGDTRWNQRYQLIELLRELGKVHRLLFRYGLDPFFEQHPEFTADGNDARDLINQFFEDATSGSVLEFVHKYGAQLSQTSQLLADANHQLLRTDVARLSLLRTISHDLGNFLNSLSWVLETFSVELDAAERSRMLGVAKRNLADMGSLVRELTAYSVLLAGDVKAEFSQVSFSSLCEEIKESLSPIAKASNLALEVNNQIGHGTAWTDPRKLRQIVLNLVSNSIKYRQPDKSDAFVRLDFELAENDLWQLTIADNGVGIPEEDLQRVFEEFQRGPPSEKIQGTGLGLAITKRLVLLLKGEIRVSSEVGRGTHFILRFPRNPPGPPAST
jgi:signal transduction histidine kinase